MTLVTVSDRPVSLTPGTWRFAVLCLGHRTAGGTSRVSLGLVGVDMGVGVDGRWEWREEE